jgi:hypothetical protein
MHRWSILRQQYCLGYPNKMFAAQLAESMSGTEKFVLLMGRCGDRFRSCFERHYGGCRDWHQRPQRK